MNLDKAKKRLSKQLTKGFELFDGFRQVNHLNSDCLSMFDKSREGQR